MKLSYQEDTKVVRTVGFKFQQEEVVSNKTFRLVLELNGSDHLQLRLIKQAEGENFQCAVQCPVNTEWLLYRCVHVRVDLSFSIYTCIYIRGLEL